MNGPLIIKCFGCCCRDSSYCRCSCLRKRRSCPKTNRSMNQNNNNIKYTLLRLVAAITLYFMVYHDLHTPATIPSQQQQQQQHWFVHGQTNVQWIPNKEDDHNDSINLPLSMKQRQQLIQLDEMIQKSNHPQQTLEQVALSNNMEPNDLIRILKQNRSDLQQQQLSSSTSTTTGMNQQQNNINIVTKIMGLIVFHTVHLVKKYPKQILILLTALISVWYLMYIEIPTSGILLSSSTTMFVPSTPYIVQKFECYDNNNLYSNIDTDDNNNNNNTPFDDIIEKFIDNNDVRVFRDGITWDNNEAKEDSIGSINTKINKKKSLSHNNEYLFAVTAQSTIHVNSFLSDMFKNKNAEAEADDDDYEEEGEIRINSEEKKEKFVTDTELDDDDDDDDGENEEQNQLKQIVFSMLLEKGSTILKSRKDITEWVSNHDMLTNDDNMENYFPYMKLLPIEKSTIDDEDDEDGNVQDETAVLVMKGIGDYGRYGLIPFNVRIGYTSPTAASALDDVDQKRIASFLTLRSSNRRSSCLLWNGAICVTIQPSPSKNLVRIQVHFIVPHQPNHNAIRKILTNRNKQRQYGQLIVQALLHSITKSITERTKVSITRRIHQSKSFQNNFHQRAYDKQAHRSHRIRELEEMAIDRRRRWQRTNPNSGSYRPSYDRMKSPKNSIQFQ